MEMSQGYCKCQGLVYIQIIRTETEMFATITNKTFTYFPTQEKAQVLASSLLADDPETDYRVVEASKGFFVAIFEDGEQVHTL